jgi:predicted pyridoxine 5'-phosphate oxidase superfamily flavin-nucleotide-binding protein
VEITMWRALHTAVDFSKKLQHIFITTADRKGMPHVAAADGIRLGDEGYFHLTGWYCETTARNLEENRLISVVLWDPDTDVGYQVLGEVEEIQERASLNGFIPETEGTYDLPQVERDLLVRVTGVLLFCHAPHTDRIMDDVYGQTA